MPPAHVGKILTKTGYKPETVPPSKFRLEACWAYCDRLILLEVADRGMTESFKLFMPKDQLNMEFGIRFTLSARSDENSINRIFDRIPAVENEDSGDLYIPLERVYTTYGQPVLREVIRTAVAKYAINEVASSRERLNQEIFQAVLAALEDTPLSVKRLAFADLQFPQVITQAKEAAAERRIEIERAEAQKQIRLVELQTELETARMERNIRKERAEAALEENRIFAQSVTDKYLAYKRLEVLQTLASNPNAVFVPFEALGTLGLENRIFRAEIRSAQ
ncbi:MAG: hypothetical protein MI920_03905 [Kiloniellales bacterium]|nr:hypothetical protein [Kiloniellales bacterium]